MLLIFCKDLKNIYALKKFHVQNGFRFQIMTIKKNFFFYKFYKNKILYLHLKKKL